MIIKKLDFIVYNKMFLSSVLSWYRANYSMAGDYEWGKNLGCQFVKNSCYHWIHSHMNRSATRPALLYT